MAYFARKLRYGAHDGDGGAFYFALIELARKKGGRPVGFVLYRRIIDYHNRSSQAEMIRLVAETAEEAIRRFWPSDAKGMGNEFPGHRSDRWERTTLWLDHVAAGGGHECLGYEDHYERGIRLGGWAKVGTPTLRLKRRKRRKKKPLQIGNLAHIILKHQAQLPEILEKRISMSIKLDALTSYDEDGESYVAEYDMEEYDLIFKIIDEIDERIASIHADIAMTKEEMRYIVQKKFPKPMGIIPKRVLRYERERKQCFRM